MLPPCNYYVFSNSLKFYSGVQTLETVINGVEAREIWLNKSIYGSSYTSDAVLLAKYTTTFSVICIYVYRVHV